MVYLATTIAYISFPLVDLTNYVDYQSAIGKDTQDEVTTDAANGFLVLSVWQDL